MPDQYFTWLDLVAYGRECRAQEERLAIQKKLSAFVDAHIEEFKKYYPNG